MTTLHYRCPTSLENYTLVIALQDADWYPTGTIRTLINNLAAVNFSTQEGRNVGLDLITSLTPVAPYAILNDATLSDTRFGNSSSGGAIPLSSRQYMTFVAGFCDGWAAVFSALMNSLNYKDRTNATSPDTPSTPLDIMSVYRQYNDASQAFRWAIQNARTLLRNRIGVYSAVTFERKYGLEWGTPFQGITDAEEQEENS